MRVFVLICVVGLILCGKHEGDSKQICNRSDRCDWRYMVYFPDQFRTGYTEKIAIVTYRFPNKIALDIKLIESDKEVYSLRSFTVPSETLVELDYFIPHDAPRGLRVEIIGYGTTDDGHVWKFENKTKDEIPVVKLGYNIFIQTDRPVYKPGQKILTRVIVVDSNLKPVEGNLDTVVIENPSGSRMRQWNDVKLEDGFASFELQTSSKPVLGDWKIKATMLSYNKEIKIEVKKYVLPKFQVTITPPPYVSFLSKEVKFEVCARYSYGKEVSGFLSAEICRKRRYWYGEGVKDSCIPIRATIRGCRTISVSTDDLKFSRTMRSYYSMYLEMKAEVIEASTRIKQKSQVVSGDIERREVSLSFEAPESFKPGLPLKVKMYAKYPDGTPITQIKVNISAGTQGYFSKNLINNDVIEFINGVHEVQIPPVPFNAESLRLSAVYRREKLYEEEPKYRRESTAGASITPWYSPSHNYLQIVKPKSTIKSGDTAAITVQYTSSNKETVTRKIFYSVMCGGNLATSGSLEHTFRTTNKVEKILDLTKKKVLSTIPVDEFLVEVDDNVDDDDEDRDDVTTDVDPTSPEPVNTTTIPPPITFAPFTIPTRPPFPETFSRGKFDISLAVTDKMFAKCRMVVYYVHGEEVVADSTDFDIADEQKNKVRIEFSNEEVRPGRPVKLVMRGFPNSTVAVAAVDKSIHFLAEGNDVKPKDLEQIRKNLDISPSYVSEWDRCPPSFGRKRRSYPPYFGSSDYVDSEKAFVNIGTTVLTDLRIDVRPCKQPLFAYMVDEALPGIPENGFPKGSGGPDGPVNDKAPARPRTNFPETWIWESSTLSNDGTKTFNLKVPDTITSWYASGFAISKQAGMGIANPTELRVFQPFFISLNLPYSVIRGEDVMVPAAIFSYLENACLSVKVDLAYSLDYQMIAGPTAKTCLCGGRTATVLFRIKPKTLGYIPLRISAATMEENVCASNYPFDGQVSMADIIVKKLLVEPEGIKKDYTITNFLCPKDSKDGIFSTEFKLRLPDNLIPDSVFSKITVMGDIMGSSLSDLDKLLAMPYGCGEQNMLKFAPNIFIMDYLNNTNQVTPEIERKALSYMLTGYQRELTYKHQDGSYSAFGEGDDNGSTWLTAFVLKTYAQAQNWIQVDKKEIKEPLNWLLQQQDEYGCFKSVGELHNKAMAGGVKTPVTLTAYVLTALLEAGLDPEDPEAEDAHYCVANYIDEIKDSYSLAIIANMYAKLGSDDEYEMVMDKLKELAINEDGMIHYEEPKPKEEKPQPSWWYYRARSTDIEQTAYALLAILQKKGNEGIADAVQIVRWLSKQRNGLGGWSSTQDTVLAMQALSEFAQYTYGEALDVTIDITDGQDFQHNFEVNNNNNLVLQRVEDVPVPATIELNAKGSGCALVQTIVNYNIQKVQVKPSFKISYSITNIESTLSSLKSCFSQRLYICVSWLGKGESNMALLDVEMVSGFEVNEDNFELEKIRVKGLKDIEIEGNKVSYYFNRLSNKPRCVELRVDQKSNVRKTKSVPMKVYDYYDTDKAATTLYGFSKDDCTKPNKRNP